MVSNIRQWNTVQSIEPVKAKDAGVGLEMFSIQLSRWRQNLPNIRILFGSSCQMTEIIFSNSHLTCLTAPQKLLNCALPWCPKHEKFHYLNTEADGLRVSVLQLVHPVNLALEAFLPSPVQLQCLSKATSQGGKARTDFILVYSKDSEETQIPGRFRWWDIFSFPRMRLPPFVKTWSFLTMEELLQYSCFRADETPLVLEGRSPNIRKRTLLTLDLLASLYISFLLFFNQIDTCRFLFPPAM